MKINGFVLNEDEVKKLIDFTDKPHLKEAIFMAYYDGLKLKDIQQKMEKKVQRRTLQYNLKRAGIDILNKEINFEILRQSCMIRLFNQGYTGKYISTFMGYSEKVNYLNYIRRKKGYISPSMRLKVFVRDNFKCVYCGSNDRLQVDHIVPFSKEVNNEFENLQTLCISCNIAKGNKALKPKQKQNINRGEES